MVQVEATNRALRDLVEPLNLLRDASTQLEETNRRLRASEEKYRRIYDNLQDVYVEASLDGTIVEMNAQIVTLSKGLYKREDLIGTPVSGLHADPGEEVAILDAIKQHGRVVDADCVFLNRDGSLIPCSVSATMVRGGDGELRTVATWRDISRRK